MIVNNNLIELSDLFNFLFNINARTEPKFFRETLGRGVDREINVTTETTTDFVRCKKRVCQVVKNATSDSGATLVAARHWAS